MMKRRKSKAQVAGTVFAKLILLSGTVTLFVMSMAMAVGIFTLPVEKLIAMMILMMYCCSRIGGK